VEKERVFETAGTVEFMSEGYPCSRTTGQAYPNRS
jgi:hypothetical protein